MIVLDATCAAIAAATTYQALAYRRDAARAERLMRGHRDAARLRLKTIQDLRAAIVAARARKSAAVAKGNRTRAAKRRPLLDQPDTG